MNNEKKLKIAETLLWTYIHDDEYSEDMMGYDYYRSMCVRLIDVRDMLKMNQSDVKKFEDDMRKFAEKIDIISKYHTGYWFPIYCNDEVDPIKLREEFLKKYIKHLKEKTS